jgi:hypothetical protein
MGVDELNFRLARIEIAIRKQNQRILLNEVLVIKDISTETAAEPDQIRS